MNDQPTDDALSRASAYLDGELAADEIAEAEADSVVMADVARLRSLQESVRDVAEPTSSARDKAIAAALAEFDRRRHPAPVIHSRSRPAYSRWLAVAAAVAGLAALGAVISSARGDDGDGDDAATELTSAGGAPAATFRASDADASGAPAAPLESAQPEAVLASEATGAPDVTQFAAQDALAEEAATSAAPATTGAAFDPATPIRDEVELGRIGRQLLAELASGSVAARSGTACDQTIPDVVLLSDALLIVSGAARPVLLAGNPDTQETFALDPGTCLVLATGL